MRKNNFLIGVKDSLPIVLGYIPIGLTLGVAAREVGFLFMNMFSMSAIVFAGSSQFIGVDMIGAGASFATIIATTFFVNFRHFMMSSAYAPHLNGKKTWALAIVSFGITDESFAIGITKAKEKSESFGISYLLGLEYTAWLSWLISTCIGVLLGSLIPDYQSLGLDFALCAMFIGLIAAMVKSKMHLAVCILSGIISLVLYQVGMTNFNVIIAAVVVSCLAVGVDYARK